VAKEKQRWVPDEHGGRWKRETELTPDDLDAIESHTRKLYEAGEKHRLDQPRVKRGKRLGT